VRMGNQKRIEEIFDNIYETETQNALDGSELLCENLSEEEKGRILNMALYKMKSENPELVPQTKNENAQLVPQRKGKKRRIALVALVAVLAFATTAFAAEVFQWDARLSNYLGLDKNSSEELGKSGMDIGAVTEADGLTVKAVQTLGDANNIYILFDLLAPEGSVIYPESRFDMIFLKVDGVTSMGYSCDLLPDESPTDNKGTMLLSMEANKTINDKGLEVVFKDLAHYKQETGEFIPDYTGEWKLSWKLDYEDSSVKYPVEQEIKVNGEVLNVESVSVSPIALNVKVRGNYIREYDSAPPEPGAEELIQIKRVTLTDGNILTQEDSLGWGSSVDGNEFMINMKMKKLLDPEKIESITLNDTVVPLHES